MNPTSGKLKEHMSPWSAIAFALGTSIGWGSLVITSNTYLMQAGPWGTVLGLIAGVLVMLLISRNYAYLIQTHPGPGGAYAFSRDVFGWDRGYLTAWFLTITYLAILWANATSIPLFIRNFIGPVFQFGRMYTLFSYDVYLGETLLTIASILLVALLCIRSRKAAVILMTVLSGLFTLGILTVFAVAVMSPHSLPAEPGFVPDQDAVSQIIHIAVISPWAFIGFESISHFSAEFSFKKKKAFRVLVLAVVLATVLYIAVSLLSVTAYPERYDSWLDYIRDLKNITEPDQLRRLEPFPAFYAARQHMGTAGVLILMGSLLGLVITSLIGNTMALSRLFFALGTDRVLPEKLGQVNEQGQPSRAIMLIAGISLIAPFAGRNAIGWIVDVTTIGAVLIYSFVSAAALKTARLQGSRIEKFTGLAGLLFMIGFGISLMLPNLVSRGDMDKETFFFFIVWILLGLLMFHRIIRQDRDNRFGNSIVVWMALVSLVLLLSVIWMRQTMLTANDRMEANIHTYFTETDDQSGIRMSDENFFEGQMEALEAENVRTVVEALLMFGFALGIMMSNYSLITRRSMENQAIANIDPMTRTKSKHAFMIREKNIDKEIGENPQLEFSVAVCDVNGLKKINDTLGHKAGDEYICEASKMICGIFKHSPVYRIGGDEFVVIMTEGDHEKRNSLMQMLHDLSVLHISSGGAVVSGGLGEFNRNSDQSFHDVFERADQQMYDEKLLLKGLGSVSRDEEPELQEEEEPEKPSALIIRRKILIVDDQMINRELLSAILGSDFDTLEAENGLEALEILKQNPGEIAVVLLDLQMPLMDGRTVLLRMQADPDLRSIPVLIETGDEQAEVECLRLGAMDFLPKPLPDQEIVRARVMKCAELSENRSMIQSTERDHLTGLYNMDYFCRYAELYDRHYADLPMDAVMVDINQFHMINERYGKEYGDGVLRRLGRRMRTAAREIGGIGAHKSADVFLLYCPHREDYADILDRLMEGLSGSDESNSRVRLRIGVYANADKKLEIERRFDRAKMAADSMRGKQARMIGWYDDEMHESAMYNARLMEDFREALEQEQFQVYFQPKYDIRPEKPVIAGAEALVRWKHPTLGMIPPAQFIPMLEESGLILALDRYVWSSAARTVRQWRDRFGFALPVSVNVSRFDMLDPDLPFILKETISGSGLTENDLILEVTESAYTENSEGMIAMAVSLREAGFRIEMDDFGTGYSSLGMLTRLPIDALKLDMTFVRSAFSGTRDVRVIQLIIDIAGCLHVPVIAEGVETEEQMLALRELGCDMVQGYYFGKPVSAADFERFMTPA